MIGRLVSCLGAMLLAALLGIASPAYAVGVDSEPLADPAQEAHAREIMTGIRCLVCQNQSIEDSNAVLAKELRVIVREQVAAGKTKAEVEAFLVERYGDWVLLKPPVKPRTWILWISPLLVLLGGATGLAFARARRRDGVAIVERAGPSRDPDIEAAIARATAKMSGPEART